MERNAQIPISSSSSLAVAASLVLHAGAAGWAWGHLSQAPQPADVLVSMQMLPLSNAPSVVLAPAIPPSDVPSVSVPHSAALPRRSKSTPASHAAPDTSTQPSVTPFVDTTPRFSVSVPSSNRETPARFVLPIRAAITAQDHAATPTLGAAVSGSALEETLSASQVSVPARLIVSAPVIYPAAARTAEVEGGVAVEIVVDAHGQVIDARALGASGYGLDDAAVRAVRGYRFSPAERAGRAVRVRMRWTVQFRLR